MEEGIARCRSARAVFVTPSHQFPLGVTMSASRRLRLLDFGRRSGAWIIEDDYDSEYRYENLPIASLQGLDRDSRVLYIGTFTKTLFISNRLGYLVLPRDLVDRFAEVRRAMDCFSPVLQQAVMADFLREGHFARYMRRMRVLCGERRDALVEAVGRELGPSYPILGDRAGTYLCVPLPAGLRDLEISERAASQKLWAAPLSDCYRGRARKQASSWDTEARPGRRPSTACAGCGRSWPAPHQRRGPAALRLDPWNQQAESSLNLASPERGDGQGAAVEIATHPSLRQGDFEKGRAERTAEMEPALAPVEAGKRETSAQSVSGGEVDAERPESPGSAGRELIGLAARTGT